MKSFRLKFSWPGAAGLVALALALNGCASAPVRAMCGEAASLALFAMGTEHTYPAWSPDGATIAFTADPGGALDIFVVPAGGGAPRRLTRDPGVDAHPAWSSDGALIGFDSQRDGNRESYIIELANCVEHRLTEHAASDSAPAFVGSRIVFVSDREGVDQPYVAALRRVAAGWAAEGVATIDAGAGPNQAASLSPDGQRLLFESRRDGNREIFVAGADGSGARNLTQHEAPDFAPKWSPDGREILFWSRRDGNEDVYVMDAEGGNPRRLTNHSSRDRMPNWGPDGRIVFVSDRHGALRLYTMHRDGGAQEPVPMRAE